MVPDFGCLFLVLQTLRFRSSKSLKNSQGMNSTIDLSNFQDTPHPVAKCGWYDARTVWISALREEVFGNPSDSLGQIIGDLESLISFDEVGNSLCEIAFTRLLCL